MGPPRGLDADASRAVLRSFLVVRLVRGTLLLLFLALAAVGVEANGWPHVVTVVLVLAMVVQAAALVIWWRRYVKAG